MKPFQFFGYIHEVIPPEIGTDLGQCSMQVFAHLPDFVFILISLCYIKKQRLIPDPSDTCLEKARDNSLAVSFDIHQLYWQNAVHKVTVRGKPIMKSIARNAHHLAVAQTCTEESIFSPCTRRIVERAYSWRFCEIDAKISP